jgi:deoxycytidylate deaminase
MNWTEYFLGIAEQVKLKSKDESTQIGAVIVGIDNEILSTGYNSFPRGMDDSKKERQERPEKYFWFEHAERNVIYNAARIGVSLKTPQFILLQDYHVWIVQEVLSIVVLKLFGVKKNVPQKIKRSGKNLK